MDLMKILRNLLSVFFNDAGYKAYEGKWIHEGGKYQLKIYLTDSYIIKRNSEGIWSDYEDGTITINKSSRKITFEIKHATNYGSSSSIMCDYSGDSFIGDIIELSNCDNSSYDGVWKRI